MIFAPLVSPSAVHSHDYMVRLSRKDFEAVVLSHLFTADDPMVLADAKMPEAQGVRAGSTEWQGSFRGQAVSLAWDWLRLADGAMEPLAAVPPRTNVRVIDAKGYDLPADDEVEALWAWIALLEWRPEAQAAMDSLQCDLGSLMIPSSTQH